MWHGPDSSAKFEGMEYFLSGVVFKERLAQKPVESSRSKLAIVRGTVDIYYRAVMNFIERVRTSVADVLFGLIQKA